MTPRKFTLLTEISQVNLRLGWKWLRCFRNFCKLPLLCVHTKKKPSIFLSQSQGLRSSFLKFLSLPYP